MPSASRDGLTTAALAGSVAQPRSAQFPALAVLGTDVLVGLGAVGGLHARAVPLDPLAAAEGDDAEQDHLGQRARVGEVGAGGTVGVLAGLEEVLVMPGRAGQGGLGVLEVGELLL